MNTIHSSPPHSTARLLDSSGGPGSNRIASTTLTSTAPGRRIGWTMATSFVLLLLTVNCQKEAPLTEPEGGYSAFRHALLSANSPGLWVTLAEETKQVFRDAWADLDVLAQSIERLPLGDRMVAKERTALFLRDMADDPEGLFRAIVRLENLVGDESLAVGSQADDITLNDDGTRATVITKAGQNIELVKEADGVWRVRSLTNLAFERLHPLSDNLMAVEVMIAESGYMRRSHEEIVRLLSGSEPGLQDGTGSSSTPP